MHFESVPTRGSRTGANVVKFLLVMLNIDPNGHYLGTGPWVFAGENKANRRERTRTSPARFTPGLAGGPAPRSDLSRSVGGVCPLGTGPGAACRTPDTLAFGKPARLMIGAACARPYGSRDPILASVSESLPHAASASARA